jgi:hypothetical protein
MRHTAFIVNGHVVLRGAVNFQLQIRIRHARLRYGYGRGVFPAFPEK